MDSQDLPKGAKEKLPGVSDATEAQTEKQQERRAVIQATRELPLPLDGGTLAWIQCAAAFCIFFNTWGLLNSFGVFQSYYSLTLLRTSTSSQISWIGTIQSSFIMIGSVYSGPLYDQGYFRPLIATGCFMLVFGMFMTSLGTQYWQQVLSQGLFMGIGLGCLFMPCLGILASYFVKRRGLAMGIASSGSTIGGIVYPIIFSQLVGKLHFGWTTRVLAFIMLFLSILPVFGMKLRSKPLAVRKVFDSKAWREPEYTLYAIAVVVGYLGLYTPYFYIQLFSIEKGIISGSLNLYLLPIINAAGFFGRIFFGHLADKVGSLNAFIAASGPCAALLFGWMGIHNEAGVIVFCLLYGFFSAGMITLPAMVIAVVLCPDMREYGVRLTMQLVPSGLGILIGNPIAGAILPSGWVQLQGFAAATVAACTLFAIAARVVKVGWVIGRKI
ncbi:Aspyridones efflux protein [Lachnellula willkommii]|uniref:Aspyridones efflux protein n=1 Tax=Lachnellula willkommii TaxID=215461 RepID=A0A559M9B3_9HELO|nr:Aspyridones efflux protein [Lachnellula willkommii]